MVKIGLTPKQILRNDTAKRYKEIREIMRPKKVKPLTEASKVRQEGRA